MLVLLATVACATSTPVSSGTRYEDLVALFQDWRGFQQPKLVNGVPDYSAPAMAAQRQALPGYQRRLASLDTTGWTIPQQVDYQVVQAEMNGLDFDHRVLRPWARNPAFYVTVFPSRSDQPAREGPLAYGAIELWTYQFPLTADAGRDLTARLKTVPPLLEQAEGNLVENPRDLWIGGIRAIAEQSDVLQILASRVAGTDPGLEAAVQDAREATDRFRVWLERQLPHKTAASGVGIENYNWYLKHVQLVPYTWEDEVTLMRRELARAWSALELSEHRDRKLPPLTPIANAAEYDRRFSAAVSEYMTFLREQDIVSIREYMDAALRARIGPFRASTGPREFFDEVHYRDPMIMRTHDYHWFDLARMEREPHPDPIRRGPLLYNIFDSRTEGFATGVEEMMLHAGAFDTHPRARELIYVLLAERAARALGDLMMHANRFTLDQAVRFAAEQTPRGWLRPDGATDFGEQHLYLQQPAYGTSYVIGRFEAEKLMARRAQQLGDAFTLRRFMDELNGAGLIPISLIHWELTGERGEVAEPPSR
jgi:hypothetical protein